MAGLGLATPSGDDMTRSPIAEGGLGLAPRSQTITATDEPVFSPPTTQRRQAAPATQTAGDTSLWRQNPIAAIGVVLGATAAGLEGKEYAPVESLLAARDARRKQTGEMLRLENDLVKNGLDIVTKLSEEARSNFIDQYAESFSKAFPGLGDTIRAASTRDDVRSMLVGVKDHAEAIAGLAGHNPDKIADIVGNKTIMDLLDANADEEERPVVAQKMGIIMGMIENAPPEMLDMMPRDRAGRLSLSVAEFEGINQNLPSTLRLTPRQLGTLRRNPDIYAAFGMATPKQTTNFAEEYGTRLGTLQAERDANEGRWVKTTDRDGNTIKEDLFTGDVQLVVQARAGKDASDEYTDVTEDQYGNLVVTNKKDNKPTILVKKSERDQYTDVAVDEKGRSYIVNKATNETKYLDKPVEKDHFSDPFFDENNNLVVKNLTTNQTLMFDKADNPDALIGLQNVMRSKGAALIRATANGRSSEVEGLTIEITQIQNRIDALAPPKVEKTDPFTVLQNDRNRIETQIRNAKAAGTDTTGLERNLKEVNAKLEKETTITGRTPDDLAGDLTTRRQQVLSQQAFQQTSSIVSLQGMLKDAKTTRGLTGARGTLGSVVGGVIQQFSPDLGTSLTKVLTGGATPQEIAAFRAKAMPVVAQNISTITGEESGRFTEAERNLTDKIVAALDPRASQQTVVAAVESLMGLKFLLRHAGQIEAGETPIYDMTTQDGYADAIDEFVDRYGMSVEAARDLADMMKFATDEFARLPKKK